ncbi:hypothetical protein HYALB_00013265 [Hymenoscyphus albidus]|uniref:Uncharacterized protein n=1 Tax=Hymenoscyphus albidus TaxID=595503 RepID=A0A9N9LY63_9HELO|nr:hypothetical protein HYALB_00013265 [Hymenoscyphus albidus]
MENSNPSSNARTGHDSRIPPSEAKAQPDTGASNIHKRSLSGGLLSKLSFLRTSNDDNHASPDHEPTSPEFTPGDDRNLAKKTSRAMAVAVQQQKTRRRKGSLRKAALLGRGAQRDRKEIITPPLETGQPTLYGGDMSTSPTSPEEVMHSNGFGLAINTNTRPPLEGFAPRGGPLLPPIRTLPMGSDYHLTSPTMDISPTLTYTSTTDEDDVLIIPTHNLPAPRVPSPNSSGSDLYFAAGASSLTRRRSAKKAKSPLSIGGLAASPLPVSDADWDYSETEWWGWVVLIVTWVVFVTGMGSCLGVWSWAWDVGETPYAPPELEDDPTLPIVGYYPALIILTTVMAWVWVVVAWVGMKYFRHAKISGD